MKIQNIEIIKEELKMIGKYYCPICGKMYTDLSQMYNCAVECEKKEKTKAAVAKINEAKRTNAEAEIKATYDALIKKITKYNNTFKDYNYSCTLRHSGKTLAAQNVSNKGEGKENIGIDDKSLDKWIKEIFNID